LDQQVKFAEEESMEFSCVCFRDYWVDQDSALLDTTFSHGQLELIIIRRGYTQGWWALALRQLGKFLRYIESTNLSGSSREGAYIGEMEVATGATK
jgi:hypothetical protein